MGGKSSTIRGKQNVKEMEDPTQFLQKGLDILSKAVDQDENHNYEEALRCYVQGVMILLHFSKYNTESQKVKDSIKVKCASYLARIKQIKDYRNNIYGTGMLFDELETLSDNNVLNMVTQIICMCGDYMEPIETKN